MLQGSRFCSAKSKTREPGKAGLHDCSLPTAQWFFVLLLIV